MFEKRGQASIFLVVAIVITIATVFFLIIGDDFSQTFKSENQKQLAVEDRNVQTFVQECLDLNAKNGIFYLGFVGGRLTPDPYSGYYSFDEKYTIPYFYADGQNLIPLPYNEGHWTGLLDRYLHNYFEACINNFAQFPVDIRGGPLESNTEFTDNSVIFNIKYPVRVDRDSISQDIPEEYTTTVPVRLREMLGVASTIIEKEVKNDQYIHWDYLTAVSNTGYDITAYTEEDDTIVYRMIDLQNKIDDEEYILQWANRISDLR